MSPAKGQSGGRNPTVLVTDSRDQTQQRGQRRTQPATRLITVDNVLQYASDIPSMQQRRMLQQRPQMRPRSRLSSASNVISNAAGNPGRPGNTSRLAAQTRLPPRTTKVTEKLVLLPETETAEKEEEEEKDARLDEEALRRLAEERNQDPEILRHELLSQLRLQDDFDVDNESAPLLAEEEVLRRRRLPISKAKSYAERLPKARRAEKLPRVTAYCTAQAYKMGATAAFVKEQHGARTKLYDDCLYTAYQLPLLPGRGGYHLRSSPILKGAGGKIVLDEAIERSERRDYHEEYIVDADEHSVGERPRKDAERHNIDDNGTAQDAENEILAQDPSSIDYNDNNKHKNNSLSKQLPPKLIRRIPSNVFNIAEMFIFGYGVVVFWNFTERQEKDILADLTFSSTDLKTPSVSLATQILSEEDFETEEFHFEYSSEIARPRVYNDMITLRSGDHMIKLAISHAIAQSTKLSFFEEVMTKEMIEAKDVPRRLATTGELGMRREEVFRILGRLFKSRVEVNLSSNMLDVPNFFWESEPTLYPLYIAVREYLEIKPRIQVLNERCRVFLDLTEILSDSIADKQVSHQTWIIIILIGISILVTASEVFLRFGLLHARSIANKNAAIIPLSGSNESSSLPAISFITNLVRSISSSSLPSSPPSSAPSSGHGLDPLQCICPPVTCPSTLPSSMLSSSQQPPIILHSSSDDNGGLTSPLILLP